MGKSHSRIFPVQPRQSQRISVEPKVNYDESKPIFSFKYMKYNGVNCLSRCGVEARAAIANKLIQLSQFTWRQIKSLPRTGHGFEQIPRAQFTVSLPEYVTLDIPKLEVFRYSGAGRMAGSRSEDIFHILVVGENLYPHL
jgi:hypothetical protein